MYIQRSPGKFKREGLLMGFGSGVMGAGFGRLMKKFKKTTEAAV
jgi:hypothetical protein